MRAPGPAVAAALLVLAAGSGDGGAAATSTGPRHRRHPYPMGSGLRHRAPRGSGSSPVGLKNDLDQVAELVDWFDWALNEECHQFEECDLLEPFVAAGRAVFGVEYQGHPAVYCPDAVAAGYSWTWARSRRAPAAEPIR